MATPGVSRYRARHGRPGVLPRAAGVTGLAAVTALSLVPAGAASAAPAPSVVEVERRVEELDTRAALAVEDFRVAQAQLEEVERRAAVAADKAAREQERLDRARAAVAGVVAAAYRRGRADRLVQLVTDGDPQTFLDRASTLDRIARSQADVLADVAAARHRLATQQAVAQRELEARRNAERELAERTAAVERALRAQQALLTGLRQQERDRVEAARLAGAAARASRSGPGRTAAQAGAVSRTAAPVGATGRTAAPAGAATRTYDGPASGRAKVAIDEGYKHLGKPYQWGGNGPDSFDCSGFTSWVWRAAGVSLPRTSRDQYAQGRKVARGDIQPGDLLYFGSPIHHVGMYVGDGQMINAPQSGGYVRVQPAFRSDFVGATRP